VVEEKERERERERESESFDSSSLRLQRRKSETEFPCRVYSPTDLDERCASEIRLNSENADAGNYLLYGSDIFGRILIAVSVMAIYE